MGHMRGKTIRGAWLLAVCLALAPVQAWAQGGVTDGFGGVGYAPADPSLWVPLGSTRPEDGGLFLYGEALLYRQSSPLKDQQVAVRGFILADDSVDLAPPLSSGVFIGSRTEALNTKQASGPGSYQPGFETGIGWKFKDQTS